MFNFLRKIKNYFLQKKLIVFLILAFLLFPIFTFAGVEDVILSFIISLVTTILAVPILITQGIVHVTGSFLDYIISPTFTSFSYTQPCPYPYTDFTTSTCNPIIGMGFDITKQFVNFALVVLLVYISLSITLKLDEAKQHKALVTLLCVALLVNFAPVFCGLIVDASNIVMNHFLDAIRKGGLMNFFSSQVSDFSATVWNQLWKASGGFESRLGLFAMAITIIIVNLSIANALFLLSGIFLVRYIIIWLLVIISPLAIVSLILPQTKAQVWDKWWNNFLQWSIIGIPISFFLYLAVASFSVLSKTFVSNLDLVQFELGIKDLFNQIFPFIIVIIFIYLGFGMGLQTSAMGAKATMLLTKKAKKRIPSTAGKLTKGVMKRVIPRGAKKWMAKQSAVEPVSFKGKGILGTALKTAGTLSGMYALRRYGIGRLGMAMAESDRANYAKTREKYKGQSIERYMQGLTGLSPNKGAILLQAIADGKLNDLKKEGLSEDLIKKIGEQILNVHPDEFKSFKKAFPKFAEEVGKKFDRKTRIKAGVMNFHEHETYLNNELKKEETKLNKNSKLTKLKEYHKNLEDNLPTIQDPKKQKEIQAQIDKTKAQINEIEKRKISLEKELTKVQKDIQTYETIERKIVANLTPDDIVKMYTEHLYTPDSKEIQHLRWGGDQFAAAVKNDGQDYVDEFNKIAAKRLDVKQGGDPLWYEKNNQKLVNFSNSMPAGGSLGIMILGRTIQQQRQQQRQQRKQQQQKSKQQQPPSTP